MKITELLIQDCVMCPATGHYVWVADCADYCDHYEGDGKETKYMKCSYEKTLEQIQKDKDLLEKLKCSNSKNSKTINTHNIYDPNFLNKMVYDNSYDSFEEIND